MISNLSSIDVMLMTYLQFSSPNHADKFKKYLSFKHPNINFSTQKEKDGCLPFLEVYIFCENEKFGTNVYRKKAFSGVLQLQKFYTWNINLV